MLDITYEEAAMALLMSKLKSDLIPKSDDKHAFDLLKESPENLLSNPRETRICVDDFFSDNDEFNNSPENRMKLSKIVDFPAASPFIPRWAKDGDSYILKVQEFNYDDDRNFILTGSYNHLETVLNKIAHTVWSLRHDCVIHKFSPEYTKRFDGKDFSATPEKIGGCFWPYTIRAAFGGVSDKDEASDGFIINGGMREDDITDNNVPCIFINNPSEQSQIRALNRFFEYSDNTSLPKLAHMSISDYNRYFLYFQKDIVNGENESEKLYIDRNPEASCAVFINRYSLSYFIDEYASYCWERDIDIPEKEIERFRESVQKSIVDYCKSTGGYYSYSDEYITNPYSTLKNRDFYMDNIYITEDETGNREYFNVSYTDPLQIPSEIFLFDDKYAFIRLFLEHCDKLYESGKNEENKIIEIYNSEKPDKSHEAR